MNENTWDGIWHNTHTLNSYCQHYIYSTLIIALYILFHLNPPISYIICILQKWYQDGKKLNNPNAHSWKWGIHVCGRGKGFETPFCDLSGYALFAIVYFWCHVVSLSVLALITNTGEHSTCAYNETLEHLYQWFHE